MVKYVKSMVVVLLFGCSVNSLADAPEGAVVTTYIGVDALPENLKQSIGALGVVYLERLQYQNEVMGNIEKYVGYTAVGKNSMGFCTYRKYFFNGMYSLAHDGFSYVDYIVPDLLACDGYKIGYFFVEDVPDDLAYKIFKIFEGSKSVSRSDGAIKFSWRLFLSSKKRSDMLKQLNQSKIESISYKLVDKMDRDCYLVKFSGEASGLGLCVDITGEVIKVIGVEEYI